MCFHPTPLGESLICAYCRMGLEGLWQPLLRKQIESAIHDVALGRATKDQVHSVGGAGPPRTRCIVWGGQGHQGPGA